jgi:Xaa-Pro aminopeptidase
MVFNIRLNVNNLETNKGKKYGIMIGDIVLITAAGSKILTGKISKKYEDISY